jgi:crotonobetainyl-CoA:carnitine CoA-transferase CaiB-like acyl-CoA transferase
MRERLKNIDASYAATAEVIATRTTQAWIDLLGDTNVPMMVVNTLNGLIEDPHLKASGFWQLLEHPTEGTIRMSKPPINFEKTPAEIRSLAPRLGENSIAVLRSVGYGEAEIEQMIATGITAVPG